MFVTVLHALRTCVANLGWLAAYRTCVQPTQLTRSYVERLHAAGRFCTHTLHAHAPPLPLPFGAHTSYYKWTQHSIPDPYTRPFGLHGVPGRACARVSQRAAGCGLGRRAQRAGRRTGCAAAGAAAAPGQLSSGGQRSCRRASGATGSAAGQSRLLPAQAGPAAQGPQGVCMCAWAHVPFCALAAWPCSLHVHAWCSMQRVAGSSERACTVASLRHRGAKEDFVVGGFVSSRRCCTTASSSRQAQAVASLLAHCDTGVTYAP